VDVLSGTEEGVTDTTVTAPSISIQVEDSLAQTFDKLSTDNKAGVQSLAQTQHESLRFLGASHERGMELLRERCNTVVYRRGKCSLKLQMRPSVKYLYCVLITILSEIGLSSIDTFFSRESLKYSDVPVAISQNVYAVKLLRNDLFGARVAISRNMCML